MQAPIFLMTGLYLLLTALVTLDTSLASLGWMPALAGHNMKPRVYIPEECHLAIPDHRGETFKAC